MCFQRYENYYRGPNPSIRVYYFDEDTKELLDYEQYYVDLVAANEKSEFHAGITGHSESYYYTSLPNLLSFIDQVV